MAIRDKTKQGQNRNIQDRDKNVHIGLSLPINKGKGREGYFSTTKTTIEAIKTNIRNFLNTEKGERLMQPNLGVSLRKYLFQPIDEDVSFLIKEELIESFKTWLPMVKIKDISMTVGSTTEGEINAMNPNQIKLFITFSIDGDPTKEITLDAKLGE